MARRRHNQLSQSSLHLQEKITTFNKPNINEKELMMKQRKKASFNSKCAKFEIKDKETAPMIKKDSLTKIKAKMFEEFEDMDLKEKEAKAERMRKEEFQKAKNKFKPQKDEEAVEEDKELQVDGDSVEEKDSDEEVNLEKEKERRRREFAEKQLLFGQ